MSIVKKVDVYLDKTAEHIDHAIEYGLIEAPKNFNINEFRAMSKQEKVNYVNKNIAKEKLYSYQNRLANSMGNPHLDMFKT